MKHADSSSSGFCFSKACRICRIWASCTSARTCREMLECDLKLEMEAVPDLKRVASLRKGRRLCQPWRCSAEILRSEEEHIDWLETQLSLIDKTGLENYTQSQMHA